MRVVIAVWLVVVATLIGYGSKVAWHALVAMPNTYEHLRKDGVPVTGRLSDCTGGDQIAAGGVAAHQPLRCSVAVRFQGVSREWEYPYPLDEVGRGPLPMLLDADHPRTAYAVYDVDYSTGAGWSPWSIFGLFVAGAGVFFLVVPPLMR
jgi:hypothetical protein